MTVEKEFIRRNMPTANCHASTVLPLDDGSVIAAWFGGSKEGNDDVDIFYSVRNEDGFQPPKQISAGANLPHWNPVLFRHNDGRISLFFKVGKIIPKWKTYRCISEDGGLTFSQPEELVPGDRSGGRGPVKNKCIRLSGGRILAPASAENRGWNCFVDISDDDGMTFRKSGII
ncbi:MAG: exo-alpha-sialidase, partial [Clostridia bacterium]|nr:exo-alpha-sialidase [Clostridia bacterium]